MATKLDDILANWDRDADIDKTEPGKELLNIPKLHNKYLRFLLEHRAAAKKYSFEYLSMKKNKEEYYSGAMSEEDLRRLGWQPFLRNLKTKQGIERYVESDEELIRLLEKKTYHEETSSAVEMIMTELKARHWQIKSFIDWERFIGGN